MERVILETDLTDKELLDDFYFRYKSNIIVNLKKENCKYAQLLKREEEIFEKYPNLRDVFENGKVMQLDKEEVKQILKIQSLWFDKNVMEDQAIYLKGIESGYLLFKKIGLIKD